MGTAETMLVIGGILLASLGADTLGRRTRLPRVTLLLIVGIAVGPFGLAVVPASVDGWYPLAADLALIMVAFLLGGELTVASLREHGRDVLIVSVLVVVLTAVVVVAGLRLVGFPIELAILLGVIATSTDPAAVADVVHESGARGPVTRVLLGVVAVDDAWGILMLSLGLAWVLAASGAETAGAAILGGGFEIVGAIGVGCAVGLPMALLTGRLHEGEPTLTEAISGVLLSGGLALAVGVSHLLAAMVTGAVVANVARHHRRPFRAIRGIEWPFMAVFFVLSGAMLRFDAVRDSLGLVAAFVALRVLGRIAGGALAARWTRGSAPISGWIGPALLPQAGVALGMALVVSSRLPEYASTVIAVTMASTVFFELVGPLCTRRVLERVGEVETGVASGTN